MLSGKEKMKLRKIAVDKNPDVSIGAKGLNEGIIKSINEVLESQEFIKIRFTDFKEKNIKKEIINDICLKLSCENVGIIGHTAVLYKKQEEE